MGWQRTMSTRKLGGPVEMVPVKQPGVGMGWLVGWLVGWMIGWLDGPIFDTFVMFCQKQVQQPRLEDCPKSIPYSCSPLWGKCIIWQGDENSRKKSRWYQLRSHLLNHAFEKKGSKETEGILKSTCDVMWVKVVWWCLMDMYCFHVSFCHPWFTYLFGWIPSW